MSVGAYGIVFFRSMGPGGGKWVPLIQIDGVSITLHFPVGRDRDCGPARVIEICLVEIFCSLARRGYPLEFPMAVQGEKPAGLIGIGLNCKMVGFKRDEIGARHQFIDLKYLVI